MIHIMVRNIVESDVKNISSLIKLSRISRDNISRPGPFPARRGTSNFTVGHIIVNYI